MMFTTDWPNAMCRYDVANTVFNTVDPTFKNAAERRKNGTKGALRRKRVNRKVKLLSVGGGVGGGTGT